MAEWNFYIKKPEVMRAVRFMDEYEQLRDIGAPILKESASDGEPYYWLETAMGWHALSSGDWIVTDYCDFWVVSSDEFANTYEPMVDPDKVKVLCVEQGSGLELELDKLFGDRQHGR